MANLIRDVITATNKQQNTISPEIKKIIGVPKSRPSTPGPWDLNSEKI